MFDISDYDEIQIYITDGWREWYIPKFRLTWTVDEPFITLYWTDTEKGTSGIRRALTLDYQDVMFGYLTPSSASEIALQLEGYIISAFGGSGSAGVLSITANSNIPVTVDNSDPVNPVIDYEWQVQNQTTDFTLALTDAWTNNVCDTVSSIEITVPDNATIAFPIGTEIMFGDIDSGLTFFTPDVGVTIYSRNNWLGIDGPGGVVRLTKIDTDTWFLDGDLKLALDVDAHAYIDAVESTGGSFSLTEQGYINNWFISAKANGYYSKYHAVYLFLGGTAAAHKFNAVNPLDTDGAFRMVFTGSPTHNANGVTWNGTTQYGDTKLVPNSVLGLDSKHYSAYMRTVGGGSQFGAVNGAILGDMLHIDIGAVLYWNTGASAFETGVVPSPKTRFWQMERTASTTADLRRNDVSVDTDATASSVNAAVSMVVGARNSNGTINVFSADNICFFAIADSFTSGEITAEYNDVQQLQTDFARNV